ncbi:hypothetical protein BDV25DRAFT_164397 [Aspergillus avenaceus]|uniref:Uncharacterized protein n=1 Tax=Aspergillus avenaceus TaxID=36643 RepID=A0A5N6TGP9_ASPAV|nr:hypothetical protein BDV25DRAFT_164397 [Aspergillus avenaceus]
MRTVISFFPFTAFPTACMSTDVGNIQKFLGLMQRCLSPFSGQHEHIVPGGGIHAGSHTIRTQARVKPSHG